MSDDSFVRQDGSAESGVLKLRLVTSDGQFVPEEIAVGRTGFNNHSASVSTYPQGTRVAWVESATGDISGVGRIVWQLFATGLTAANDNGIHVTDAFGCEPAIAGLAGGETLLTWIDADGNGHGHLYPAVDNASGEHADARYAAANAALADLGPIAALPDGSRRVQVDETRPGNLAVMWLALADHGFVLRGSMFLSQIDPRTGDAAGEHWTQAPITDIRMPPGFAGPFSLQTAGDGSSDLVVTYATGTGTGAAILARRVDGPGTGGEIGHVGPEFHVGADLSGSAALHSNSGERTTPLIVAPEANTQAPSEIAAQQTFAHSLSIRDSGVLKGDPIITATKNGYVVTWETPGATENTVTIKMALFDAHGIGRALADGSTIITVADNALASVAPSITGVGSGAAIGYVDGTHGSLMVKAYDGSGDQVGGDVVVDDGGTGAISEIALESQQGEQADELAVVYIRDDHDDQPDYGSVMLQRYLMPDEHSQSGDLIALGADGQHDGADGPVELGNDGSVAAGEDILGRAPSITSLDDGDLAIVWVENDGVGETIKGRVLEGDGKQVLTIDLTGLLQDGGIVKGTKPILLASGDDDILVSWMQPDGADGGYIVMAALYRSNGPGQWIAPEQPVRLQEFDREPQDFSVVWADHDGTAIDVVWRTDSSGSGSGDALLSKRFDLDGNDIGHTKLLAPSASDMLEPDTHSTASLVDGQIVVVYTEESKDGDVDLAAHVIDTQADQTYDYAAITAPAAPSAPAETHTATETSFTTSVDEEITLNLTADDSTVSFINGKPITAAEPVDVGSGWVQIREDGSLTVSPDAGYVGEISFDYATHDNSNGPANHVTVNVTSGDEHEGGDNPASIELKHEVHALSDDISTAQDIKLADIEVSNTDVDSAALSLAGLDADLFKIVGTTLYLKAGIDLDFDTKPKLSVEIRADGPSDHDQALNFALDIESRDDNAGTHDLLTADTFVFAPGFGEATSHTGEGHETIDVSSSGYTTFQELLDSGALVQSGADVVITLDPADPSHSDRITLRGIDLSTLTSSDFKF